MTSCHQQQGTSKEKDTDKKTDKQAKNDKANIDHKVSANIPLVDVQKVQFVSEQPTKHRLGFTGVVTASKQQDTYPDAVGTVSKIMFKKGQFIKKGTPLYTIEQKIVKTTSSTKTSKSENKSALTTAKAKLKSAQKSYEQYQEALNLNKMTLEQDKEDLARYQVLIDVGAVSEQAYDQALSKVETTESAIKHNKVSIQKAQADIETAKANIAQIKSNLKEQSKPKSTTQKTSVTVKANSSGVITHSKISKGSQVSPQSDYIRISTLDPILVDLNVDSEIFLLLKQLSNKKALPKVQIVTDDGKTYPEAGEIIFNSENVGKVQVSVSNKKGKLMPDMIVKIVLPLTNLEQENKVAVLPLEAVQYFPIYSASNKQASSHQNQMQHYVYLFDSHTQQIKRQFITVDGLTNTNQLRVTGGLRQGDKVVINSNLVLQDKQRVKIGKRD